MNKNIGLMALTGILTLASCSQTTVAETTKPAVMLTATPGTLGSAGGSVKLSVTATDDSGIASVSISSSNGGPTCTPVQEGTTNVYSCTVSMPANTSTTADTVYNYTASATDKAITPNTGTSSTASVTVSKAGVPVGSYKLTVNVTGVSGAVPVTITNSSGSVVYTGNLSSGNSIPNLPNGTYIVTGSSVNGMNAPATTVTISGADASTTLAYTSAPAQQYTVTVVLTGVDSTTISVLDANGFPISAALTNKTVKNGDTLTLPNGTYSIVAGDVTGYTTPAAKTIVVSNANTGVKFDYVKAAGSGPSTAVFLDADNEIDANSPVCAPAATSAFGGLDGWMVKTDGGTASNPVGVQTNFFVKGKVNVYLPEAVVDGGKVEAYFQSTQPNSAVQKLDVKYDEDGNAYVTFDSTFGNDESVNGFSQEGYPTDLWFRVNNTTVKAITLIPDNLAPEAINPQVQAARSIYRNGAYYAAGDIVLSATNTNIQDKPLVTNPQMLNSGFEQVCYFMVPDGAMVADYGGDNPEGLNKYVQSVISAAKYATTTPITSAGQNSSTRNFIENVSTATAVNDGNGWVTTSVKVADGAYKVYAVTYDKLGNARPSGTPFRVVLDNTAPNMRGITAGFVDDSPLPFPAKKDHVSDYAKFTLTGDLTGADSGVGLDTATFACTFNGINLFDAANNGQRFDTNKWPNGLNEKVCGQNVKDLLGNYNPNGGNQLAVKVVVDNQDPIVNITAPVNGATIVAGETYRPEATIDANGSDIRSSYVFWQPIYAGETVNTYKVSASTGAFNAPVELARAGAGVTQISGIEWRAPSFADQDAVPTGIKVYVMAIDEAGNATLRSRTFAYTERNLPAYEGLNAWNGEVYPDTVSPTYVVTGQFAKNTINANAVTIAGTANATLDSAANPLVPSFGTMRTLNVYGRFNASNWDDIRNYQLSAAANNTTSTGDLTPALPTGAAYASPAGATTGDPSYLAANTSNSTNANLRNEWNNFSAPWMTLQGVTNTTSTNDRYKLTNSLYNTLRHSVAMNGTWQDAARHPVSCPTWTYCTYFTKWYDQMNAIAQTDEGNFVYFGSNVNVTKP